jgi:hypothetical protein
VGYERDFHAYLGQHVCALRERNLDQVDLANLVGGVIPTVKG